MKIIHKLKYLLLLAPTIAYSKTITLPASGGAAFTETSTFIRDSLDFVLKNLAPFAIIIGMVSGVIAWAIAPEGRGLGWAFRALFAGVILGTLVPYIVSTYITF